MNDEKEKTGKNAVCVTDLSDMLVSVSCITFNHRRFLRKALDSFLEQETDFRYEILIHDDASTDGTREIIEEYAARYPDIIRPMLQSENQYSKGISNISGVFNFPRARGRYIAMCEGDDFWSDPHKLQIQADYMEAHPECALCCHAAGIVSEDGAFRSSEEIRPFEGTREIRPEEMISKKTNLPTASLFFRTEDAQRLPQWYYDCPVGDIPLQLFMLSRGTAFYFDRKMSMYRMGAAGSWGQTMDGADPDEVQKMKDRWEKHYEAMEQLYLAFDRDTEGVWREAVREALARQRFRIDLKQDRAEAVLDPANREFLRELPAAEQRLMRLKARHPGIYRGLQNLYHALRRQGR